MNNDKLKALLAYGFALEAFLKQLAGGFNLLEIPAELVAAVKLLTSASVTIAEAPAALQQWIAMTDADAADVEAFVAQNYGANPDKVDAGIEAVLNLLISLHAVAAWIASKI